MSPPGELAMFLAAGAAAIGLFFGPIGTALGRRLSGRAGPGQVQGGVGERDEGGACGGGRLSARSGPDDLQVELEQMNERMAAEVEVLRGRLSEVEERLDFAERLLPRGGPPDQIPEGVNR